MHSFDKIIQLSLIPLKKQLTSSTKDVNIAMISVNAYGVVCCLKITQVFTVSLRDLQYQAKKETKAKTYLKSVVPKKYYNFVNVFSNKNLDTLSFHWKYDHKI